MGKNKHDFLGHWLDLIYTEAFRRLGIQYEFRELPLKRAAMVADMEQVDGEISRGQVYAETHPNLTMVTESHFPLRVVAFTVDPDQKFATWEQLCARPLSVDYMRGADEIRTPLEQEGSQCHPHAQTDVGPALSRLIAGWTDVFVNPESITEAVLNNGIYENVRIYHGPVLASLDMHAFLLNRHAVLADRLAKVLRDMKREGLIEKFRLEAHGGHCVEN